MNLRNLLKSTALLLVFSLIVTSLMPVWADSGQPDTASGRMTQEELPAWAQTEIEELAAAGIMNGYEDGTFRPERMVTRAEFVTTMTRLAKRSDDEAVTSISFSDVGNEWFAESVYQAVRLGWVQGFEDGTFRPHQPVTRQEAAVMLNRYLKLSASGSLSFQDRASIPSWAASDVAALAEAGLLEGFEDGTFQGGKTLTRAESAVILHRIWTKNRDAERGSLTIKALDPAGKPLSDAGVTVHRKGERSVIQWGRSGKQGSLVVSLPFGEYEVAVQKEGYAGHHTVVLNQPAAEVTITAELAATLSGKLIRTDGKPASGILLSFTTNPTFFTITGDDGSFRVSVLSDRSYRMSVIEGQPNMELYTGDIPPVLQLLDSGSVDPDTCGCRIQNLNKEIASPHKGEASDIGSYYLSDINAPIPSTGGVSGGGGGSRDDDGHTVDRTPPGVPANVTAAAKASGAELHWDAVGDSDLAGYRVYTSLNRGDTWRLPADAGKATAYTVTQLTYGQAYTFAVTAVDYRGNESAKSAYATVVPLAGEDSTPPAAPTGLTAVAGISEVLLRWNESPGNDVSGYNVYLSTDNAETWEMAADTVTGSTYTAGGLVAGTSYTFAVTAVDTSGNESVKSAYAAAVPLSEADHTPPSAPTGLTAVAGAADVVLQWTAPAESDVLGYKIYLSLDNAGTWGLAADTVTGITYTVSGLMAGVSYTFAVTAMDTSGNESAKSAFVQITLGAPADLPPDPGDVATNIPADGSGTFADNNDFLYTGSNPIQAGVEPGAMEPERLAVLRGTVLDDRGQPLPGATVSILGYEGLGHTLTRADGKFDLAVNGGSWLTVNYEKDGYMPVQRKVNAPWQDYVVMPDVTLKAYDNKATEVELTGDTTGIQVAQGNPVTDADGTRQATVLIPPATTAFMKLPDGQEVPLTSMHMRATEYTVGDQGPQAMPGELPSFVGYTYAVELSADEAVAAQATEVRFDRPLYTYVDNFLGFPVGELVPSGYYDRQTAQWVPSPNGIIIQIVDTGGGIASIDSDGDGTADNGDQLAALGFTDEERRALAALYPEAGKTLWRVPIKHFTPWDFNWPYGPPGNAINPPNKGPNSNNPNVNDPCKKSGSIIGCQEQTLGEVIPVTGTNLTLNYYSRRAEGYAPKSSLEIPVVSGDIPDTLTGISVDVEVAGKHTVKSIPVSRNAQPYLYQWDGKDAYGRQLTGSHPYKVTVKYHYRPVYYSTPAAFSSSFGQVTGVGVGGGMGEIINNGRQSSTITTERVWYGSIESPKDIYQESGIAGWSLDAQHVYDPSTGLLEKGSGFVKFADKTVLTAEHVSFREDPSQPGKGISSDNKTAIPTAVAVGPDGDIYLNTYKNTGLPYPDNAQTDIFRMKADGEAQHAATMMGKLWFDSLEVDADGNLYATSWGTYRIWKKRPIDADWVPIAGTGTIGEEFEDIPDGVPATDVNLYNPKNLEIAADGSLYFTDELTLYRISPDGLITGLGKRGRLTQDRAGVDSGPVTKENVGVVEDIDLGPDGSLYLLDRGGCSFSYCAFTRIRKLSADGTLSLVAGNLNPQLVQFYDGIPATEATFRVSNNHMETDRYGNVYFMYEPDNGDLKLYRITTQGTLQEVGSDFISAIKQKVKEEGGDYSRQVYMRLLATGPYGDLLIQVQHRNLPDDYFSLYRLEPDGKRIVADENGLEAYEFDTDTGRHIQTRNALTGGVIYELGYDEAGRLMALTDRSGNVVQVERDAQGVPTAIVAPGGQRTALTVEQGRLTAVANPAGDAYRMQYEANGLLREFTDPNHQVRKYGYDANGLLTSAENPLQGVSTLERESLTNGYKVTYTTADQLKTVYEVTRNDGELKRVTTDSSGGVTTSIETDAGTETIQYPDGTKVTKTTSPDTRWGNDTPVLTRIDVVTPLGRSWSMKEERTIQLQRKTDPFSLQSMKVSYTMTENSEDGMSTLAYSSLFDAGEKAFTETSAEGIVTKTYLDEKDRVAKIEEQAQGIDPLVYSYDDKGRIYRIQQGDQFVETAYDEKNRVKEESDASGRKKRFVYDDADRVVSIELPDDKIIGREYDDAGNLIKVTMPDGTVYRQTFNGLNRFSGFAPDGESDLLSVDYTAFGKMNKTTLADGRDVQYSYDASGRIGGLNDDEFTRSFTYEGNTERVNKIESIRTDAAANKQAIAYQYDGSAVKEAAWSGKANGKFVYTYDGYSNLTNIRMSAGTMTNKDLSLKWDKDHQLTQFGPFTFSRTGPGGRISSVKDSAMEISTDYDSAGRAEGVAYKLGGEVVYQEDRTFDERGLMTDKTVTSEGLTETYAYTYDDNGQLTYVTRAGSGGEVATEAYSYDDNQNRKSREVSGMPAEASEYGEHDVLEKAGDTVYTFDDNGYMTGRGGDTFRYGPRGELLEAAIGGAAYSYTYDGIGRRTARESAGQTKQYLFGNPDAPHMLTNVIDPDQTVTSYYYDDQGLLLALERGGVRYYVITDGLGTPQRVLQADKTVVKELRYDSFGVLLSDSNPAFKLDIGYAGGIWDEETKLNHFGFRDYDPRSGRWTARDPILFDSNQANLYAYVNNNPIALRDPCGLFCMGASAYEGLGGGGKVCITDEGVSACAEAGVGIGGGLEINPFEDLSATGLTAELTFKAGWGPVSFTDGLKVSSQFNGDCAVFDYVSKLEAGPFGYDFMSPSESSLSLEGDHFGTDASEWKSLFKKTGFEAQAALKTKACAQYKW